MMFKTPFAYHSGLEIQSKTLKIISKLAYKFIAPGVKGRITQ